MTRLRVGLTIIVIANLFITISAQTESQRYQTCSGHYGRTTRCLESESCCQDNNGYPYCCSGTFPWWGWVLCVFAGIVCPIAVGCFIFWCLYYYNKRKKRRVRERARRQPAIRPIRRFQPSDFITREETSSHNNVEANTNKDAPPSYSDVSQNAEGQPPSYPGA